MPRNTHGLQRFLFRLFVLSLAGWALNAIRREPRSEDEVEYLAASGFTTPTVSGTVKLERWEDGRPSPVRRRAALAMAFTTLFFAGAALTAGAGDQSARLLEEETTTLAEESAPPAEEADRAETPAPEAAPEAAPAEPAAEPAPEPAPAPEAAPEAAPEDAAPATGGQTDAATPDPAAEEAQPTRSASAREARAAARRAAAANAGSGASAQQQRRNAPAHRPAPRPQPTAEEEAAAHGGEAVVWLNRALPDPTPPARRLSRKFARGLVSSSRQAHVDWALVLGVLRAEGHRGRVPATPAAVRRLARRLRAAGAARDEWAATLTVMESTELADKAVALARYNRAVGMESLVRGLSARKDALALRLLKDRRISIYAGGRSDLTFGRIDVRVVALMSYLAESFGQVTVTSLFSGHRLYARPGVVSAHIYGHAVDVAGLAGRPITGNQEPGGLTEQAVRSILLLPAELQPRQVISLLGLGGASFPLANHHDHVHVGY